LQFVRSLPGVVTVLAGMSRSEHVLEDLAVGAYSPEPENAERLLHGLR
jgi:predicted aldo/keto reductase-like oxidoreductase